MANKFDVQMSIIDMQSKKSALGAEKAKKQQELSRIKGMLKVVKQNHETHLDLVSMKKKLVDEVNAIELDILRLTQDIKKRQLLRDQVAEIQDPKEDAIKAAILVLREKYKSFAGDRTRINNMRTMANDFAAELDSLLSKFK